MLILGRSINQEIIIGDDAVRVKVLGFRGDQVVLGLDADRSIPIHRKEIFRIIEMDKKNRNIV